MSTNEPRTGIEKKILTTILWVGILPVAVVLTLGYISTRSGQSSAVQQTLQNAARKTAEGIVFQSQSRMNRVQKLANSEKLVEAMAAYTSSADPMIRDDLHNWFSRYADYDEEGYATFVIYDANNNLVVSTESDPQNVPIQAPLETPASTTTFNAFGIDVATQQLYGSIITPIVDPDSGEHLGSLQYKSGINSLVQFALGNSMTQLSSSPSQFFYQMIYRQNEADAALTVFTKPGPDSDIITPFSLDVQPTDPELINYLDMYEDSASLRINKYPGENPDEPENVLLAFHKLMNLTESGDVYVAVYQPTANVYSAINRSALFLVVGCTLFIGILCINAYRDVHNNIVRPVSLLNEGAQIIRQGDFDLKLKIGTKDEIEELASSFNKMALALKSNIQQLEDSEEKHRSLVNSLRDGIYQTDLEGHLSFLNPEGLSILGYTNMDKAVGEPFSDFFVETINFMPSRILPGDESQYNRERLWLRKQNDETICVELTRNRLVGDQGEVIGMEGTIRDVTQSVQLEDAARERSERISAINQIANVINSSLEAGRLYESLVAELKKLVDFDYAAVALLSETGDEFDGRQLWPDEEELPGYTFTLDAKTSCSAWVAKEHKCLLVNNLTGNNGAFSDQFPVNAHSCLCVPLYATGRIIGSLNLAAFQKDAYTDEDVEAIEQMAPHLAVAIRNAQLLTNLQLSLEEVTRARERLHEANEELKTLDELKTNLLSNVSHELRTPLVSVMGYNDMILNGKVGPINKTQHEYLEISLRNIEKLVTLIENLLDFSRLHRGDERLVFDAYDLADCARMSVQMVQPIADSKNIEIRFQNPESPILVEGDKGKMGQVFNNLLSNAVKFNADGGWVELELRVSQRNVEAIVRDSGIGIPQEALDKIFTRFYQYDASSTRKYGGTGIGLAIAQDIVRLHGSSISVTSNPGEGSEFRFTLSLSASHLRDSEAPVESEANHLLVELLSSDRPLSGQIRDLLFDEGMDMIHATTPDLALSMAQRHHPDCILMDVSTAETAAQIFSAFEAGNGHLDIPIVLLTNDDDVYQQYKKQIASRVKRSFRKSSLLSGIHHALSKGVSIDEPIGHKILCVDDDPEILEFVSRCLGAEGYETHTCNSGDEAVVEVANRQYGLVLLDIAMPGIDGWETCQKIKSDPALKGIKIYMVTAKPIDYNTPEMGESGADGFLLKPFRPEDLIHLVQGLELKTVAQ